MAKAPPIPAREELAAVLRNATDGVSTLEIERRSGVSQPTAWRILHNTDVLPKWVNVRRVGEAFGCDLDRLRNLHEAAEIEATDRLSECNSCFIQTVSDLLQLDVPRTLTGRPAVA